MKLILDMASIIQTGLRKTDSADAYEVEHEGRIVKINPAIAGYDNVVGYLDDLLKTFKVAPSDLIMVFEGKDSKKRRMQILSTYKSGRGKSAPEYYEEYNKCKDMVKAAFRSLGAIAATQDFAEGDDTCKFIAEKLDEDSVIVTNDGDLTVVAGVNPKGFTVRTYNGSDFNKMPEGVFAERHIALYKALVGDTPDSVKGVPGFGQVAWDQLTVKYALDGLDEIAEAIDKNDIEKLALYAKQNGCKLLTKIVDNWNSARTSWRVVKVYSEWVHTRYYPLVLEGGICVGLGQQNRLSYASHLPPTPDERLTPYMQKRKLVTADNFEECYNILAERMKSEPNLPVAFDIETSTTEDSDEWLTVQGKEDGVDAIGSFLVGFSLTFGLGGKRTYYVSVKHYNTNNVSMSQARRLIELVHKNIKPIHNSMFELPVLYQAADEDGTLWRDHWKDSGEFGFLPNIEDTLFMSSYVNENAMQRNLKALSRNELGYAQTEFNDMRTVRLAPGVDKPYPGGRVVTRVLKEPLIEDGEAVLDSKGKPKLVTVRRAEPVVDAEGAPVYKRVRNKATGLMENVPKTKDVPVTYEEVIYKMHELPATEVFDYGCDDTICTIGYYNYAKLAMLIDDHYHVYRDVEIDAAYLHAKNFVDGFPISIAEISAMRKVDMGVKEESERVLHAYLVEHGWTGTTQPKYTKDITPAQVKEAYAIVMGIQEQDEDDEEGESEERDPVMAMRIRKMDKIVELIAAQDREGADVFAHFLSKLLDGEEDAFNSYVGQFFDGKPRFSAGSVKDKCRLLYDVMKVTIKVRKPPTLNMKRAGIREGNPSADNLAIDYAILECKQEGREREVQVLEALKLIVMVNQREGLYYAPYPNFIHWKTGKVHSSHRQCHANTRRASSAEPNMQQASAHEKIEGFEPRIRAAYQPHKVGAVIVSMDFNAQELRLIADDSQDPNMLACYVGDNKRDMHSITGSMIALDKSEVFKEFIKQYQVKYQNPDDAAYYAFVEMAKVVDEELAKAYKLYRSLGKKINFTALYGAMAPKVAVTLMISEEDAQIFIDARAKAFRVSEEWKEQVIVSYAKEHGFVRSRLGAKRHLAEMLDSTDRSISSKAERQAANFRIQGSAAEMTKKAEGRMWRMGLFTGKYDAVCIGPIHDEVVASVMLKDLPGFLKDMHWCMTQPYADMKVEVMSSIEFGPNMCDLIEIGMEPTDEAIEKGIAKLKEMYPQYA